MPKLLYFVEKSHPILREKMPDVTDFTDPELHQIIEDMCFSILPEQLKLISTGDNAAGMAANQWGIKKRIFLFTPDGSAAGKKCEVMINPSYIPYVQPPLREPITEAEYEGCFSIPLAAGLVNRYQAILATFYDRSGKKIERLLEGWEARVFQHETDHLDGKLYDGVLDHFSGPECLKRYAFTNKDEMMDFWNNSVVPEREKNRKS